MMVSLFFLSVCYAVCADMWGLPHRWIADVPKTRIKNLKVSLICRYKSEGILMGGDVILTSPTRHRIATHPARKLGTDASVS